jgi:hypothetical protein
MSTTQIPRIALAYDAADRCSDCGHEPGCGCTHDCTPAGSDPFGNLPNARDEWNEAL